MSWKEKVMTVVTGKNATERAQEKAAYSQIKQKQRAAYLKAQEDAAIKYAQRKAQYEYDQKFKKIQNQQKMRSQAYASPFGGNLSSSGGSYSIFSGQTTSNPMTRRQPIRRAARRGRSRARTRVVYRDRPQPPFRPFGW